VARGAYAQEQAEWNPVSAGPVTAWTAPLCEKGALVVQPFLFYNRTRGTFDQDGHYDSLATGDKKHQVQEQLFMQYGITDRLEIDGQIVYQQNYVKQEGVSARAQGFGDSYVFGRYCFLEEQAWFPHLTGLFQVKVPAGKYEGLDPDKLGSDAMGAASGGGSWDYGCGFLATKKIKPFVLHVDCIYNVPRAVKIDEIKTKYAPYINADIGIEYFLCNGFNLTVECNGFWQDDRKEDGVTLDDSRITAITLAPGIGWSCDTVQTLLTYQRTIDGVNTDANDSVAFTLVYTF